ncbi:MAG: hypothetical protein ACE5OT_05195 [Candidatus Hadarchaeaceae archaeon]
MFLLALALALGFKHAYDADHLVAVSNFLIRSPSIRNTASMSLNWALGHMLTAGAITLLLYVAFSEVIVSSLSYFELGVGAMLIVLGVLGILWETGRFHVHLHQHGNISHAHPHVHAFGLKKHFHPHLLTVGVVQGFASNDELFTLLVISLGVLTLPGLLLSIGIFSLGVALGMVLFGCLMSYPVARIGVVKAKRIVGVSVGVMSIFYGAFLLLGL